MAAGAGAAVFAPEVVPWAGSSQTVTGTLVVADFGLEGCGNAGMDPGGQLDMMSGMMFDGETHECPDGPGGWYSDIYDGATVIVKDGSGATIGTGLLSGGLSSAEGVSFAFRVEGVGDADFYEIGVGDRGGMVYDKEQLELDGWMISLTLGEF